ncbi:MAG: hypothetical protein Q4D34_05915 [Eggerthellaceae bacterium]|nr:hypothetical protein [Eggerthellaceae bacterium]
MDREIGVSWKRTAVVAIAALIVTVLALGLFASQAQAMKLEKPKESVVVAVSKYKDRDGTGYEAVVSLTAKSKNDFNVPTKVKVSNKAIVDNLEWFEGTIDLSFKKPGKATLSYKWKGKKHKVNITVKKYHNPLKSLKIGSKQYKQKFDKYATNVFWTYESGGSADSYLKGKIKVTPKKNWKVKSIKYLKWNSEGVGKVKSGEKLPKSEGVIITCYNKKTKVTQKLYLY